MIDEYGLGRRFTNTGTAATSITADAKFGGFGAVERLDVGCYVLITSGTRDGDVARLSSRPKVTTGLASVDPSFGAALANADTGVILYRPLVFDTGDGYSLFQAINQALAYFVWERRLVPLTMVTDGDMLSSVTTSYSEVGSGALTKVAATFPLGQRVLRMTGVVANDYIKSAAIPVEPETSYYLEVLGMIAPTPTGAAADTGTLVLYDETNGASITLNSDQITIDTFEPKLLINNVTMPAGCKQVTVRLEADNAGDVIDWAYIILRKNEQANFVLPDRPQIVGRIGRVLAARGDNWAIRNERNMREIAADPVQLDAGLWALNLRESVSGLSLWYEEFVQPAALTTDAATTNLPKEGVGAVAAMLLLEPLRERKEWSAVYLKATAQAAYWRGQYQQQLRSYVTQPKRLVLPYA